MKTITTTIKYAYVKDIVLLPNILFEEKDEEGNDIRLYKTRLSISYDLKDSEGNPVEVAHREHFSDANDRMLSYDNYKAWQAENEAAFIAADKLELAGYGE